MQIPLLVKLLLGLFRDRKVATVDKLMVAGALAYLAMPVDLVTDFIPFLGMVDDIFLISLTVRRLIRNAGYERAARHWDGDPAELKQLRIEEVLAAAALFLPRRVKRKLKARVD
jgi:uncharacterized membrane protein YkvA (DUF1232 family)